MRRPLLLLLALFAVGVLVFQAGRTTTAQFCGEADADELAWLRSEFKLGDPEMTQVRAVHESYRPQCAAMCGRIAAKNQEVIAMNAGAANVSAEMTQKLTEAATLRAECQAEMLRHFYNVSRVMPPEQGRRYLSTMCRMILTEPMTPGSSQRADHGKH